MVNHQYFALINMGGFSCCFTHGILGFFYICHQPSPGYLECWVIHKEKPCLSLTARGQLPRHDDILRISHTERDRLGDPSAIQIILEYKSGEQFSSLWSKAALYPHDMEGIPEVLHFVSHNDSNITSGQGSLGERPLVGSEGSCRTTEDGAWVLDTQGQKILWLPTLRGSYRRCCGGKLLLQGSGTSGGQLTLLDLGGKLI